MHTVAWFSQKILSFVQFFYIKNRLVIPCEKKIGDSFFFPKIEKKNPTAIFYLFEQKLIKIWVPFFGELVRITTETTILKTNYRLFIFRKPPSFKTSFCKIEICSKTKMLQKYIARYLVPSKLDIFFKICSPK